MRKRQILFEYACSSTSRSGGNFLLKSRTVLVTLLSAAISICTFSIELRFLRSNALFLNMGTPLYLTPVYHVCGGE